VNPPKDVAVISDIHANLEALEAVLADIDRRGIRDIVCLGDIVGYGPDPVACVDLIRSRCSIVVCGNHDEAVVRGPIGFHPVARQAILWTRSRLRPRLLRPSTYARWGFIVTLANRLSANWGDILLVHGSPRDPTSEYVLPRHAGWPPPGLFEEIFSAFPTVCLVGHTHMPGIFTEAPSFTPQSEIDGSFVADGSKLLINVGSVGQPRDHDPRASYLTIVNHRFEFHRVEYPIELTQGKIRGIPELDESLATRLAVGE
jgi:predicted phosphodiesterase